MAGPKGSTKGKVHDVFANRIKDLRDRLAKYAKDGYERLDQREWYLPRPWVEEEVDLHDIEALKTGFEREAINTNYEECMQDATAAGTNGDVMSLKQQIDYNAAEERALRLRHASPVRCATLSCVRRRGHYEGRLFEEILKQVTDLIQSGAV